MTVKRYLVETKTTEGKAKIVDIVDGPERPIIRLEATWFHPQGGGQKADRGRIGEHTVLHVAHSGTMVDHYVDSAKGFEIGGEYPFAIDQDWRRLNSVFHTGGHLIASVVEAQGIGLKAIAGHQWPGEARVEFEGSAESIRMLETALPEWLAHAVDANFVVAVVGDPYTSRAIQIGDFKPIPCGGTHVGTLSEISAVRISAIKKKGGRVRVSYDTVPSVQ